MASYDRIDRISQEVHKALDEIIRYDLRDPRIGGTWSIVRCEVTRDLRYCKARISILEADKRKGMMAALKSASGFIRHSLAKEMIIRQSPELIFVEDRNIAYGAHIAQVLHEVGADQLPPPEDEEDAPDA